MLRFGDCRGVQLLRMGRLVYSLLTMPIWATRRQGGGADRALSSVERFATFWGIHGEFGTTSIIKLAFPELWLFSTGSSPVRVPLYRYFNSI